MIDLHTHILPFIDDGAGNVEEALSLTDALHRQNIEKAVCTPHFDPSVTELLEFIHRREASLACMSASKIELITGSETYLHEYLFHYPDISSLCIGTSKYLLLELPFSKKWDPEIYRMLKNIMDYYNLIPVIAHIERYPAAKKRKTRKKLIHMGCVLQLNTPSVLHKKTKRRAYAYIKKGCIDVLGSDCHNMTSRPPEFLNALELINAGLGEEVIKKLADNAQSILDGNEIRGGRKSIGF